MAPPWVSPWYVVGGALIWYFMTFGFYIGNMGLNASGGILLQDTIYASPTLKDTITLSIVAVVVAILAGLNPAFMASRMEPVDALRGK